MLNKKINKVKAQWFTDKQFSLEPIAEFMPFKPINEITSTENYEGKWFHESQQTGFLITYENIMNFIRSVDNFEITGEYGLYLYMDYFYDTFTFTFNFVPKEYQAVQIKPKIVDTWITWQTKIESDSDIYSMFNTFEYFVNDNTTINLLDNIRQ